MEKIIEGLDRINPAWLKHAVDVKCNECGCAYFKPVLRLRRIPKLISGTTEDIIIPVRIMACTNCSHVNEGFDIEETKPE